MKLRHAILALMALVGAPAIAHSEDAPFSRHVVAQFVVRDDGMLDATWTEDIEIKSQAAVQTFGQYNLPVNEHFYQADVVEAYTVKADGRHIAVTPEKLLKNVLPNASTFGIFDADVRQTTIVFPDVEAGDTVHFVQKTHQIKSDIFNGFELGFAVSPSLRFASFVLSLDAPVGRSFNSVATSFTAKFSEHDGRKLTTWTLQPQPFQADEPLSLAPINRAPHVRVATYRDWSEIGKSYLDHAAPMSVPTDQIRALADDITKDKTDRRDQAVAIYNWVAKNIRYVAINLGQGGWVPHSADSIVQTKFGDCKDHATLMRALLAAKGIDADYVMINIARVYKDYELVSHSWDHMILYIPEFDRYVDATSPWSSFDSLPLSDVDKPVLLVTDKGSTLARTPPMVAETNRVAVKADVTLRQDGTTTGTSETSATGPVAYSLRAAAAQVAMKGSDEMAKKLLGNAGWRGNATIEPHDPSDHTEPFVLKSTFDLSNNFLEDNNPNAIPYGVRYSQFPWAPINDFKRLKWTQTFVCSAETYSQTIDFHLPDGVTITNVPKDVAIDQPLASLKSHYVLDGQTLHVERTFVSRLPGSTCTPDRAKELADIAEQATKEFGYRPQFKRPEETNAN